MSDTDATQHAEDEAARPAPDLQAALRRARVIEAEHSEVIVDLRAAEIARLEELRDELEPVYAQIPPEHAVLFDGGLVPGFPPRLWIDIVSFVEMGRDRRLYRFLRDSRSGRAVLFENASPAEMANKITDYIAHRLVERERMLAEDAGLGPFRRAIDQPVAATPSLVPKTEPSAPAAGPPVAAPQPVASAPRAWPAVKEASSPPAATPMLPAIVPDPAPTRSTIRTWAPRRGRQRDTPWWVHALSAVVSGLLLMGLLALLVVMLAPAQG